LKAWLRCDNQIERSFGKLEALQGLLRYELRGVPCRFAVVEPYSWGELDLNDGSLVDSLIVLLALRPAAQLVRQVNHSHRRLILSSSPPFPLLALLGKRPKRWK
jgi:hypothetical protein